EVVSGRVNPRSVARNVLADPGDGLFQPLVERVARLPVPQRMGQGRAGEEAFDLAGGGADAVGFGLDLDGLAHELADPLDQLADRDVVATADVHRLAECGVAAGDGDE